MSARVGRPEGGPKVPDVEANIEGTDTVLTADRYVPDRSPGEDHRFDRAPLPAPGFSPGGGGKSSSTGPGVDAGRPIRPEPAVAGGRAVPLFSRRRLSYQTPVGPWA
jgi:hypothetical protein